MKEAIFRPLASVGLALLVVGCGGGVGSTPAPPPIVTPTPTPTPATPTLTDLISSQTFGTDAVTSKIVFQPDVSADAGPIVSVAYASAATINIAYDAASNSYTVTHGVDRSTFSPNQRSSDVADGLIGWRQDKSTGTQFLAIIDHQAPEIEGLRYVGAGYWQRNSAGGSSMGIEFDAFTYGYASAASAVPRSGTANYEVGLFGFVGNRGEAPLAVEGDGRFEVDFLGGVFRASGSATAYNLAVDYWTGPHGWNAGGVLVSGQNRFQGMLTLGARYRTLSGPLVGQFYGPDGQEIGGVFRAEEPDAAFVGTLVGRQSGSVSDEPFNVLPNGVARPYFTVQQGISLSYYPGTGDYDGSAPFFPTSGGRIQFDASGGIHLTIDPSSSIEPVRTFAASDRIVAETDLRYTVYENSTADEYDRLTLFNPGPSNPEIALTYTSFGRWSASVDRSDRQYRYKLDDWFIYGVQPRTESTGRTGIGTYAGILRGSGVSYDDGTEYMLVGSARVTVDFGTSALDGELRPVVTPVGSSAPSTELLMTFASNLNSVNAFETRLNIDGLPVDGQVNGRLFGPTGEELGGTFQYWIRDEAGFANGSMGGVFVTKLQAGH